MSNLLLRLFFSIFRVCIIAGAWGCASGHVPGHSMPQSQARPENLKPMIDYLDKLSIRFPTAKKSSFDSFRAELIKKYQTSDPPQWPLRQAVEIETAVQVLFRDLSLGPDSGDLKTRVERDLVLKHFPETSEVLQVRSWPIAKDTDLSERDPRLDALKSGVSSLTQTELDAHGHQMDPKKQTELCGRIFRLQAEADYLGDLYEDQLEMRKLSPFDSSAAQAFKKYKIRLGRAVHELEILRPELAMARQTGIFRGDACRRP